MTGLDGKPRLEVRYQNERPVDLQDLGNSLTAIAERYRRFDSVKGERGDGRLYVREIRPGSIIADLVPLIEHASLIGAHQDIMAAFMANLNDLFGYFLRTRTSSRQTFSDHDARQVQKIIAPMATGGGSQTFNTYNVTGDLHLHTTIQINANQADQINEHAQRFIRESPTDVPAPFTHQVLRLTQVREDGRSRMTDRGIIAAFWETPVKLIYANDRVRQVIVDRLENPFRFLYVVDGEVQAGKKNKPSAYLISAVRDSYVPDEGEE